MSSEDPPTLPFRVVVESHPPKNTDQASLPPSADDDEWSLDDIEAAYQQALESLDTLESTVADVIGDPETAEDLDSLVSGETPIAASETTPPTATVSTFFPSTPQEAPPLAVSPRQVVEALLFVGGTPLSSRKLSDVMGGSTSAEDVLRWIDELNELYDAEGRPYRIELVEGGYQMQLRSEFEKVRHRVYGFGPREVKLSQEVLEILAFIAYSQPVSEEALEGLGRAGTSGVVRQLLRRELVHLVRRNEGELCYETTPRFLEVFGLRSLHDLPLPGDFAFK